MTAIAIHEWKQYGKMLFIWTAVIAGMNFVLMMIFPEMAEQMEGVTDLFSGMGSFSAAFGMNRINVATPMGFYGIEGGTILSVGGGMLAAVLGGSILSKEEQGHTAEFLFTMPHRRQTIVYAKLITMITMVCLFSVVCLLSGIISFIVIGEELLWKEFLLYHMAQLLLQLELGTLCFGISAFFTRASLGADIGIAVGFYFLQLFINVTDKADWLKYLTPYYYADAANVLGEGKIEAGPAALGILYGAAAVTAGVIYYGKRDLRS